MVEFLEPGRIIIKFSEISDIVNAVQANMNEPGLNGKRVTAHILENDSFIKFLTLFSGKIADKVPESLYENVDGFYHFFVQDKFTIFIKTGNFEKVFTTYFHELGHIASIEFIRQSGLPKNAKICIFEMLATAFEYWACEQYNNQTNGLYLMDPLFKLYYEVDVQSLPENINSKTPIARASFDNLLIFYEGIKASSFKTVYKALRVQCMSSDYFPILD